MGRCLDEAADGLDAVGLEVERLGVGHAPGAHERRVDVERGVGDLLRGSMRRR